MAKEKKRGFFSWLGFGQKEQPEQPKAQEDDALTRAEPASEELTEDATQRSEEAAIVAAEQAADSEVLLEDASQDSANESPAQTITPPAQDDVPGVTAKVNQAAEEEAYARQQAQIVTEEVESIETFIARAEFETPSKEALTETEEAAYQAERAAMEARIVEDEVASVETLLSETTAEQGDAAPAADREMPAAVVETPVEEIPAAAAVPEASPVVAESPAERAADELSVAAAVPEASPVVAESPAERAADELSVAAAVPEAAPAVAESPAERAADELPAAAPDDKVMEERAETVIQAAELDADEAPAHQAEAAEEADIATPAAVEQEKPTREGFFARLKRSLVKTKQNLGSGFMGLFRGKKIDDDLFEELEEQLLIADVGVETTRKIIAKLTETASRKQLKDAEALYALLKEEMSDILAKVHEPLQVEGKTPFVILMVGVNGVGKTTTIGKLARQFELEGKSVMLAAGDTFRAAAVEQLQVWGERNNIPVVAQHTGADSASVIFDAIQAAKARHIDVLIADTAGRLQNKAHLMEELKKIVRVMKKLDDAAPHEIMLTLDASTGQNAISQAKLFHEAVGLTGITLTKLDGTAKGGVIFSIADQFGIPIRYIGVGEQLADLRPFNSEDFIEALFARED